MKNRLSLWLVGRRLARILRPAAHAATVLFFALPGWSAPRQQLRDQVPAVARAQPVNRLPASSRLQLAIGLPLRNSEGLASLVQEISDPASPNFRRYLTPMEFTKMFGPTEKDYEALISFARANGLAITATYPGRSMLDVSGSVEEIEKVFRVNLRVYPHPTEGRTFYAPDAAPSLELDIPVLTVNGLDNFLVPSPKIKIAHFKNAAPQVGSGPNGSYMGADFRAAYVPGVTLTGAGQSVGLLQFDGFYLNDIIAYEQQAGLPNVPVTTVLLNGYDGTPSPCCNGAGPIEVALDIEMAVSMAPGLSQVIVYEGRFANSILQRMADDNLAKQLSASWDVFTDATTRQLFQRFAVQGQTFLIASGDFGAVTGDIGAGHAEVNVTSVGGTVLQMTGDGAAWASETVWQGSAGGINTSQLIPVYQQGIDMSANQGSTTYRNIPDVAMCAEGVHVIAWSNRVYTVGGTSVAAPLWAAFIALVNQQAAATGNASAGLLNPALYTLAKRTAYSLAFHDITVGNNTNNSSPTRFFATPGYDLCTGWGSPTGANLIDALVGPPWQIWVAFGNSDPGNGTYDRPYNTVARGRDGVLTGGSIFIKGPSSTPETLSISKAMKITAAGGQVTIGRP
jgi:subtilase family serine protease